MRTSEQPAQPAAQAKAARSRQGVSQTAPLAPVSGRRAGLGATGQSVASRIAERYGHARGDTIVIERAKALDDTLPSTFKPQDRPALRYFDPKRRADAINRRVPRLDESLYPDMTAISARDDDPFATAMRAMDRAMGTQRPAAYATGATGTTGAVRQGVPAAYQGVTGGYGARGSQGRPAAAGLRGTQDLGATRGDLIARSTPMVVSEEEGHVDELVREEFEINRSGASRRYSRSRLTMIDGGDQAASPRRGGRHFANVS
jgi:hypothetical protein